MNTFEYGVGLSRLAGTLLLVGTGGFCQLGFGQSCIPCDSAPVVFGPLPGDGVILPVVNFTSERVSLDSTAAEILLGDPCEKNNSHPSGSDDGNAVAWVTRAKTVDLSSLNGFKDKTQVYLRKVDGSLDTTQISKPSSGLPDEPAEMPRLSGDGDWLVFTAKSDELSTEDTLEIPNYWDVFLYHLPTDTYERMSESVIGHVGGNGASSGVPDISPDGRFVVFESKADDLQTGVTPCVMTPQLFILPIKGGKTRRSRVTNIYMRDRGLDLSLETDDCIEWISPGIGAGGCENSRGLSARPTVSANGCLVAFESTAPNLVLPNLALFTPNQIYVRNRTTGVTKLVSQSSGGAPGNGISQRARISRDARYIVFESQASNLVAGDTNGANDVFVYDVASEAITRLSLGTGGAQLGFKSATADISGNGRFVAYTQVGGPDNFYELYVVDRDPNDDGSYTEAQASQKVSVSGVAGIADGWSGGFPFSLTTQGKYVFFMSIASDLGTSDTNCLGTSCVPASDNCDDGRDIYRQQVY